MEKMEILNILNDWNFWKKDLTTGIERDKYLSRIKKLLKMDEIVVIAGIRRAGKSTTLLQFCNQLIKSGTRKEDILIINFEDPRFSNLNLDLLNRIYELYLTEMDPKDNHYVILDEIHVIDGWEKFARYLLENKKISVFVTGSSSKLLSSEYSTVLAGRHMDIKIFPLSFQEFLKFKGLDIKTELDVSAHRHKIKRFFSEYLKWGGFPKVALTETESGKRDLLDMYFRDIIIKDIVARHGIKDVGKLEDLAKYYLANISSLHSFNKIKNTLKMNLDTVERFSKYLSDVFLLCFVKKFSYSEKEQLINPRKVYAADMGIRNSVAFVFSKDIGRLAENMVFTKLARNWNEIFYWKSEKGKEVDFVVKDKLKIKQLIQVCWNMGSPETIKRETGALFEAMEIFGLKEGLIITEDKNSSENINGKTIKYIPLWKWLLN